MDIDVGSQAWVVNQTKLLTDVQTTRALALRDPNQACLAAIDGGPPDTRCWPSTGAVSDTAE